MSIEVLGVTKSFGSFAVASVLALLALVTLLVKTTLEWRTRRDLEERKRMLTLGGEA